MTWALVFCGSVVVTHVAFLRSIRRLQQRERNLRGRVRWLEHRALGIPATRVEE